MTIRVLGPGLELFTGYLVKILQALPGTGPLSSIWRVFLLIVA
jgi:hypothetical protein